jgi:hypothetical protein
VVTHFSGVLLPAAGLPFVSTKPLSSTVTGRPVVASNAVVVSAVRQVVPSEVSWRLSVRSVSVIRAVSAGRGGTSASVGAAWVAVVADSQGWSTVSACGVPPSWS